jgi:hypothetical protein
MATYKLFLIRDGSPVSSLELECAGDLCALDAAHERCTDYSVEVWEDGRLVARVNRNDEPLTVLAARSG